MRIEDHANQNIYLCDTYTTKKSYFFNFNIFFRSGEEPGDEFGENLKAVDIPEDVVKKFHEDDRKELEFAEKERLEKLAKQAVQGGENTS